MAFSPTPRRSARSFIGVAHRPRWTGSLWYGRAKERPVKAHALGGRHYRGNNADQNFDSYSVEYTFPDGSKLYTDGRNMAGVDRGEVKKLLVLEQLPKPVNFSGGMEPLTIGGSFTLAEILGTVPVEPDGSAWVAVLDLDIEVLHWPELFGNALRERELVLSGHLGKHHGEFQKVRNPYSSPRRDSNQPYLCQLLVKRPPLTRVAHGNVTRS